MKKDYKKYLLLLVVLIAGLYFGLKINPEDSPRSESLQNNLNEEKENEGRENEETEAGPDVEREYFEKMHYPYGSVLPANVLDEIWRDIKSMPKEQDFGNSSTSWISLGPNGMQVPATNTKYTGRILDINVSDTSNIIVASASGGLWKIGNPPVPLTEQLSSQVASSFDVQPGNSNVIILGTGEPFMRAGTGFYKTTNGGLNWVRVLVVDSSTAFKVRYSSANVVHVSSQLGYYRSDDNGTNWTKYFSGNISDFAVHPINNNIVYCSRWSSSSGGVYKTTDAGSTWIRMSAGIDTTNVGRTSIAISGSNPNFVYVLMSNSSDKIKGIYRTAGGDSWINVSAPSGIFGELGNYANVISVSPSSSGTVMIGGVFLGISTNFGMNWITLGGSNVHADHHSVAWDNSGQNVWNGNDGGLSFSNDQLNFNTLNNNLPITQFNTVDISQTDPNIIIGGSQDNGTSSTTDGGLSWSNPQHNLDGSGTAINPFIPAEWYTTTGVYGGDWDFEVRRTTNSGINWTSINTGIDPSYQWWNKVKTDNTNPINIYTNSDKFLYYSTNKGNNWIKRNNPVFAADVWDFAVRNYNDTSVIYVCTISPDANKRIYIQTGSVPFNEISAGIPAGMKVQAVTMHPSNINTAYAVIQGMTSGQKIYKTINRGVNWTNITSNLPNIPAMCMTIYPNNDDVLYLGSEMGCFKSSNGGANWFRWNEGLPEAAIVSDLKPYFQGGEFYILVGTYGRGVWKRKDDDVVAVIPNTNELPVKFMLHQNYPNPFNPVTNITYDLPKESRVTLIIYDIAGREVTRLVNNQLKTAGSYSARFEGVKYASGVYFYRIEAEELKGSKHTAVIKMVLMK